MLPSEPAAVTAPENQPSGPRGAHAQGLLEQRDASSGTKRNLDRDRTWVLAAQRQKDKSRGKEKFRPILALSTINPRISWSGQQERDEHIQPSTSFPFHSRTHSRDSSQTCDILMKGSVSFLLGYPQDKLTWHSESEVYPDACTLKTVAGPHCHSAPILDIFTT